MDVPITHRTDSIRITAFDIKEIKVRFHSLILSEVKYYSDKALLETLTPYKANRNAKLTIFSVEIIIKV